MIKYILISTFTETNTKDGTKFTEKKYMRINFFRKKNSKEIKINQVFISTKRFAYEALREAHNDWLITYSGDELLFRKMTKL